ncbi:MAG: hypothetical protein IJ634_00030 [Bacteroidales bacterium]|nr:hypothetical protein [Bacteroidales bacterium]
MKKTLLLATLLLTALAATAQDTNKVRIKPYGFVRNYLNVDSRRMMTVCGGEYLMIPYDEDWNMTESEARTYNADDERFDRNAVPEAHFLALSTRFGLALEGARFMGFDLSGKVEGDFAGFGNSNTVLRLRLAYVTLRRKNNFGQHELLLGQDWHPLSGSIMPDALGMAAGAPFRPHSRTPQIRYTLNPNGFGFSAAALWQYQFTSPGPDGESTAYANRSLVPELFVGLHYRTPELYAQLGMDYTNLLVRREIPVVDYTTGATLYNHLDEGRCHSFSPTVYLQYTPLHVPFALKFRSTLAQNLGHLNMLSGYAWAVNADGDMAYIPMQASVSYLNLSYGSRWRVNLFLGYQKNLGLANKDYSIGYGPELYMKKGINNINSIYRLAPSISFNTKAFNIGLEYELTGVTYGDLDLQDGTVPDNDNLHQVLGHRLCALVKYNF